MPNDELNFLLAEHPVYAAQKSVWEQCERRMLGGQYVFSELLKFDWEIQDGAHHTARKQQATYLNWPDRFATLIVGHLMRQAPQPDTSLDFGTLGDVRRLKDVDRPTRAELLYYNTDGVGSDGSEWDNFWTMVARKACCFGHMWVLAEGPENPPQSFNDELNGLRPYISAYSPLCVTNWGYEHGQLAFAVIKRTVRDVMMVDNQLQNMAGADEYLVLTRRGFMGFGTPFNEGGWALYDAELNPKAAGKWTKTGGDIPMAALFYERVQETEINHTISRPGIVELGNLAVSYMNLCSAADFDAWDGATSVQAITGASVESFNLFVQKIKKGSRYAPLPADTSGQTPVIPQVHDASTGSVTADVFDRRLTAKRQEAIELMLNELHSAPYASGASKQISWTDSKAPRLAIFASEIESAQNAMLHFMEQLWGARRPTGSTQWRREFDMIDPMTAAQEFFTISTTSKVRSPTLEAKIMVAVAKAKGWITDNEEATTIEKEYLASAKQQAAEPPAQQQITAQAVPPTGQEPPNGQQKGTSAKPPAPPQKVA